MFGDALKPNPRFEKHFQYENVTTSEESAIKEKVKELEMAMSIDEENITMGDSQWVKKTKLVLMSHKTRKRKMKEP